MWGISMTFQWGGGDGGEKANQQCMDMWIHASILYVCDVHLNIITGWWFGTMEFYDVPFSCE